MAALLRAEFPDVHAVEIADAMLRSAIDLGSTGKDSSYGNGLVQALGAMEFLGGGSIPVPYPGPSPSPPSVPPPPAGGSCQSGFVRVKVKLQTDDYGEQLYWWIVREEDSYPIALGTKFESNKQYEYSDCLPSNCYTFSLFDSNGDGFEGSYSIVVDDRLIDPETFASSVSHRFGVCPSTQTQVQSEHRCVELSAVVQTDEYPTENKLRLVNDADGSVVFESNFDEKFTLYEDMTACLDPDGCYRFEMEDEYGDGLCVNNVCDGFVTLVLDGEVVVTEDDANFGSFLSVSVGKCL